MSVILHNKWKYNDESYNSLVQDLPTVDLEDFSRKLMDTYEEACNLRGWTEYVSQIVDYRNGKRSTIRETSVLITRIYDLLQRDYEELLYDGRFNSGRAALLRYFCSKSSWKEL